MDKLDIALKNIETYLNKMANRQFHSNMKYWFLDAKLLDEIQHCPRVIRIVFRFKLMDYDKVYYFDKQIFIDELEEWEHFDYTHLLYQMMCTFIQTLNSDKIHILN
jgi:hypothetical protein